MVRKDPRLLRPLASDVKKGYCWFTYDDNNTSDNYNDDKITLGGKTLAYDMATAANVAKCLSLKKEQPLVI